MKLAFSCVPTCLAAVLASCSPSQSDGFPVFRGDYFGQEPPGSVPEEFASAFYADYMPAFGSVFSPDLSEFYFVADIDGEEGSDILVSRKVNGVWTEPEAASFNSAYNDNDMCFSPDGNRMFWRSWRPLPDVDTAMESSYIWSVSREQQGWSDPLLVLAGGVPLSAGYPSMTRPGTLYFTYPRGDAVEESDVHYSRYSGDHFATPVNLGESVNTEYIEGDMAISPDESYLVVAGWDRPDNVGGRSADLYVSFRRTDGNWTEQINLGPSINTETMENVPTLSPDGGYFFFFRYDSESDEGGTFWVDARVIEALRPTEH